jgi:hypothetical protein
MINPNMLLDLARLTKRYSPEDWDSLIKALEKPELRRQILHFAQQMKDLSIEARRGLPQSDDSGETNLRKVRLLREIRSDLRSRKIGELRELAFRLGVQASDRSSRTNLIETVIAALARKDVREIRHSFPATMLERDVPDDYSRWGEVIMGRTPRSRK